jgi:hypothetical protein
MILNQIPTEQTTAVTDLLISVLAVAAVTVLRKRGPTALRGILWRAVFQLLALAALFGGIVHGLVLGETSHTVLWWATYLALSLLIAAFFVATARDLWGDPHARQLVIPAIAVALGFFSYFVIRPDSFLPFILYESVVMLFALASFLWLTWQGNLPGSAWIAASIAVNIIAAVIQATGSVSFTVVWSFDHNGAFHLVQMLSMALLVRGLWRPSR